jgi:hypothetical protein
MLLLLLLLHTEHHRATQAKGAGVVVDHPVAVHLVAVHQVVQAVAVPEAVHLVAVPLLAVRQMVAVDQQAVGEGWAVQHPVLEVAVPAV